MKKRILVFTDSRGQHKPAGTSHKVFADRLAKDDRFDVDMFLCPMKWTTTLDFIEQFPTDRLTQYDHVILYTGIVDWSPRPAESAQTDLYDNKACVNEENLGLNTRDYSKKIVNNKKAVFDSVFGAKAMDRYLSQPFDTMYEDQPTLNMYGLEMAQDKLIPILAAIPNLIFVTANRFVPDWEGDFKRGRPANISITERYSELFAAKLGAAGVKLVDLRSWSHDDVRTHTCDNLHLTERGNDYIYDGLMELLNMTPAAKDTTIDFSVPEYAFTGFGQIESISPAKRGAIMAAAKCEDSTLATLIVGVRHNPQQPERLDNLKFLLRWIDHYYGDLFDVLLMEQDSESRLTLQMLDAKPYVRLAFAYNPQAYNRGWCYNVAVRHHCPEAKVVALLDTDVLTGPNFLRDVIDCHGRIDVASPYLNIYYTSAKEARKVQETMSLSHLTDKSCIKNPVTVSGGIVIWNRAAYMSIKGFEQYLGYSCEDRAMDVTIFNHIDKARIRIAPQTYVHLFHETDTAARSRFKEIYTHLTENYRCTYDKTLSPFEFIHKKCHHVVREQTNSLMLERARDFGDPELYRRGDELAINGVRLNAKAVTPRMEEVIFPPDFKGLDDYAGREVYANTPEPDSAELAQFYNRFQGQRCFIIGNGPSLNKHDLSLLENEYSFGVNSFYYKTRETGFRPTFYVVEDSSVMKENIAEIRAFDAPYKFFPTIYRNLHPKTPNSYFFNMNRGFYEKTSPNYAVPRFSTDASQVLYCGQSVTYINLQLAFFMGFTEVYLIGMDFDYVIPKSHKRTGDVLLSNTDDPNHFHKDYFGAGKTWKDPKLDRVLMNYRMANLAFSAVGRKIYNATAGGKLEIFERADYEVLLRGTSSDKVRISAPILPVVSQTEQPMSAHQPIPAQTALLRKGKWAKLQRDPHAFFQDARIGPLRSMRHFFTPIHERKRGAGAKVTQAHEKEGFFSFLPASRRRLAARHAALETVLSHELSSLRKEVATMQRATQEKLTAAESVRAKDYKTQENTRRSELETLRNHQSEQVAKLEKQLRDTNDWLQSQLEYPLDAIASEKDARDAAINDVLSVLTQLRETLAAGQKKQNVKIGNIHSRLTQTREAVRETNQTLTAKIETAYADQEALSSTVSTMQELIQATTDTMQNNARALDERLAVMSDRSISMDLASVLRVTRTLWAKGDALASLKLQPETEHGHAVLMAALVDLEKVHPGTLGGKTLIEIGATRERVLTQGSTEKLAMFTALMGMRFVSVDMDPENTRRAERILGHINPLAKAVTAKGEEFLFTHAGELDFVYLDAFDFDHGKHSDARQKRYQDILHTEISDEACWLMHETCARALANRMPAGGIVVLDDTWTNMEGQIAGKGKLALPLLLDAGFEIFARTRMTIALRRVEQALDANQASLDENGLQLIRAKNQ